MTESKADETPVAAEGAPPSAVYEVPSPVDSLANANPVGDLAHLAGMTTPASGFGAAGSEQERKDAELAAELQAAAQADTKRIVVEGVPFPTSTRPCDEDLLPPFDDLLYFVDNFGRGWFCEADNSHSSVYYAILPVCHEDQMQFWIEKSLAADFSDKDIKENVRLKRVEETPQPSGNPIPVFSGDEKEEDDLLKDDPPKDTPEPSFVSADEMLAPEGSEDETGLSPFALAEVDIDMSAAEEQAVANDETMTAANVLAEQAARTKEDEAAREQLAKQWEDDEKIEEEANAVMERKRKALAEKKKKAKVDATPAKKKEKSAPSASPKPNDDSSDAEKAEQVAKPRSKSKGRADQKKTKADLQDELSHKDDQITAMQTQMQAAMKQMQD